MSDAETGGKILDLMEALKASLAKQPIACGDRNIDRMNFRCAEPLGHAGPHVYRHESYCPAARVVSSDSNQEKKS